MIYYTSLFLIIVLVSVVAVWMYRGIFGAGKSVYKSSVQGGRNVSKRTQARLKANRKARQKAGRSSSPSAAPTPWGWNTNTAYDSSRRGHADLIGTAHDFSPPSREDARRHTGWPYKEEKVEYAGKAYKVNRKAGDNGDVDSDGKPWVW